MARIPIPGYGTVSGLFYSFAESQSATELTANAILDKAHEAGLSFSRASGLAAIREIRNIAAKGDYIKALRNDLLPNPLRIPKSLTGIRTAYSYKVSIRGRHSLSGEKVKQYVTVTSDDLLTKSEVYDTVADFMEADPAAYQVSPDQVVVESVVQQ